MLSSKIASGAFMLFLSRLLSNGAGFVGMLVIARLLTPDDYGLVAIATSLMFVVSAMVDLPVAAALVQFRDVSDDDYNTAFTLSLIRGAVVVIAVFALSYPAASFFEDDRLSSLLQWLSLYPLFLSLKNAYFERYARDVAFGREAVVEVAGKVVSLAASIAVAVIYKTYWALAVGLIAAGATQCALTYILCPRMPGFSLKSFDRIWNFAVWLGASWFVTRATRQADQIVMGKFLPTAVLGQFSMGSQVATQIFQITTFPVMRSLFAGFSQISNQPSRLRHAFLGSQSLVLALLLPVGFGLSLLAEPLILLLLGETWKPAAVVVQFLTPIMALGMMTEPCKSLGMALGRTRTVLLINVISLAVRLPSIFIGLWLGGLIGLLWARVISDIVIIIINMSYVKAFIDLSIWRQTTNSTRSFASVLAMSAVVLLAQRVTPDPETILALVLTIACLSVLGALVYAATHLGLWKLAGQPDGPESKLLSGVQTVLRRVAARRPAADPGAN